MTAVTTDNAQVAAPETEAPAPTPVYAPLYKDRHTAYILGAWAVLMVLTAASWWVGADHDVAGLGRRFAGVSILVLTFAKIYVVGNAFMELRESARWLNACYVSWCVGLCVVLSVMYLMI